MDGHPGWMFLCDLNLHNCCCYKAGRTDHSGNEQLLLNLVPSRPLALVMLKNGSCARSSALKCAEQVSRVVGSGSSHSRFGCLCYVEDWEGATGSCGEL